MMRREKKLFNNIFIFAIGNMGGKVLQFLLLPFYTYVLSSSEYGQIDILQAVVSLAGPLVSLSIVDAVFRYAMEFPDQKDEILSFGLSVIGTGLCVLLMLTFWIDSYVLHYRLLVIYLAFSLLFSLFSQYIKAMEKNVLFTGINLLQVFLICLFSILALRVCRLGVRGYFLAYIAGDLICVLLLFFKERLWEQIHFGKQIFAHPAAKQMLKFSIPLIPNATCWWLINFLDRIMITAFYGAGENGIYTVAHKIPTVITVIMNIFFSAWQISANQEFGSKDSPRFFGRVYEILQSGLILIAAAMIPCSRLVCKVLFSPAYYGAWRYIPVMLLGITFFSFAQFLGSIYSASKRTAMAFVTNLFTALINGALNYVLLLWLGTYGAAVATTLSYVFLWLIRTKDTRVLLPMVFRQKFLAVNLSLLTIEVVAVTHSTSFLPLTAVFLMLVIFFLNGPCLVHVFFRRWTGARKERAYDRSDSHD